jgi:hypothetical protein
LSTGAALAGNDNGNNGQAIGQDALRLALTQCSNAGIGNGGEWEAAVNVGPFAFSVVSDCFEKSFLSHYSAEEAAAILAQSTCVVIGNLGRLAIIGCEVDPGNSAAHNANNR